MTPFRSFSIMWKPFPITYRVKKLHFTTSFSHSVVVVMVAGQYVEYVFMGNLCRHGDIFTSKSGACLLCWVPGILCRGGSLDLLQRSVFYVGYFLPQMYLFLHLLIIIICPFLVYLLYPLHLSLEMLLSILFLFIALQFFINILGRLRWACIQPWDSMGMHG